MSAPLSPGQVPSTPSRSVWLVAGILGAAALSAVGGVAVHRMGGSGHAAPAEEIIETESRVGQPVPATAPVAATAHAGGTAAKRAPAAPRETPAAQRTPAPQQVTRAPVCADCGVVESVRPVTKKGEASGVGAVAGGLLGAVVGNQMGKGNGRTAMTAIGAVGGGIAGHEIEKRTKSTTVYEVGIRMDDGSLRTLEQSTAPRSGERVRVEGRTLRPITSAG